MYVMFQIAAFGNPLLDVVVQLTSNELLRKHNLNEDDNLVVPADRMKLLYEDIKKLPYHVSPGGCAQNTIRVLQWLLQKPNATIFFGGIGSDEHGATLKELVQKSGVTTRYLQHQNHSTGTCIALVNGPKRTLVAHLGAAEYFSMDALTPEILNIIKSVYLCYVEGFFLINRLDSAQHILNFCIKNKTALVFNLCGVYLIRMFPEEVTYFAECCDILIGNENELLALGEIKGIEESRFELFSCKNVNKGRKLYVEISPGEVSESIQNYYHTQNDWNLLSRMSLF